MKRSERWLRNSRRGMSLVEVMVVIAIVLTVSAILAGGVWQVYRQSQVATTELTLSKVAERIHVHKLREGVPQTMAEVYLQEPPPRDSWGSEILLEPSRAKFDLVSWGEDRQEGGTGFAQDLRYSELQGGQ